MTKKLDRVFYAQQQNALHVLAIV